MRNVRKAFLQDATSGHRLSHFVQQKARHCVAFLPLPRRERVASNQSNTHIEGGELVARIRTIKPSFWGDEKVSQLSRDARLLMIGLMSFADDDGRFLASHQAIAGYVFPNDSDITPKKLSMWLDEIRHQGLVVLYNGGRIRYGALPKFRKHQRISHPQDSTLPPPPADALFPE